MVAANHLHKLFNPTHYQNLEGGLLEGLGKLLDPKSKVYIYPHKTKELCLTTKSFFPPPEIMHIYKHFTTNEQIVDISGCDETAEYLHSAEVMTLIKNKDPRWESLVPSEVLPLIKDKKIFQ